MAEIGKIPSLDALPVQGVISDLQTVIQARPAEGQLHHGVYDPGCAVWPSSRAEEPDGHDPVSHHDGPVSHRRLPLHGEVDDREGRRGAQPDAVHPVARRGDPRRQTGDAWLKTESPPEAPAPLPKVSSIDPAAAWAGATVKPASALESMSSPTPLRTYLAIGGVALGALLLMKLVD